MSRIKEILSRQLVKEVFGVLWLAFTLLAVSSLISFDAGDIDGYGVGGEVQNLAGIVGAYIAFGLFSLLGGSAYVIPVITMATGLILFRDESAEHTASLIAGGFLFILAASILLNVFSGDGGAGSAFPAGGVVGMFLSSSLLVPLMARAGTALVGFTLLFLSILVSTRVTVKDFWLFLKQASSDSWERLGSAVNGIFRKFAGKREKKPVIGHRPEQPDIVEEQPADKKIQIERPKPDGIDDSFKAEQTAFKFFREDQKYCAPPFSFLNDVKPVTQEKSEKELLINSRILTKKLADFGIEGEVVKVLPGPVITLYEFEPAPGVKVSRIVNLADDLAMGLRAVSVRILAPVPGKAVVGIEVPNRHVAPVSLKRILASDEFRLSQSKLTMALGKDTGGLPVVTNLAGIPHLLIAGATGAGKSVGLNAMIISILYKSAPSDVKFIMIDPKMLELSIYDGIPHLIAPVVTNPKKAANALRWAVSEMERRYQLLADYGFRNIDGYNQWVAEEREAGVFEKPVEPVEEGEETESREERKPLPYIVVIIDELADLMMVASKDVEEALARLAQMARAAGIHLIVATQRPSVDVLTGTIKANFPARISFQVTSRIDSRTILDTIGSEKLLGKGDMLFLPPGTSRLRRIHGPFVSDEEVKRVVNFLRKQGRPIYNEEILKAHARLSETVATEEEDDDDEYFEQAVEIVARTRQASISMIQRKLRIGYNRAARIIENMEAKGMVGPADGAKPRRVLIPPDEDYGDV